ncbi:MAG: hypothetical protein GC191_12555 [Azospirillum sp.]|nr:hypothetical protein [Azospirillum sp.]
MRMDDNPAAPSDRGQTLTMGPGLSRRQRRSGFVPLVISAVLMSAVLISSCGAEKPVACLPDEIAAPAVSAAGGSAAGSAQAQPATSTATSPGSEAPSAVHLYLDASGSMKQFVERPEGSQVPDAQYVFPLIMRELPTLFRQMGNQGRTDYARFSHGDGGRKPADTTELVFRQAINTACYREIRDMRQRRRPEREIRDKGCDGFFNGNDTDFRPLLDEITKHHAEQEQALAEEHAANPRSEIKHPRDLYLIVSDFMMYTPGLVGNVAPLTRPLSNLIDHGLAVGLLAVWTGFDGTIYDLPGGKYHHSGRLPFYILAVGSPSVVTRWWEWVQKDLKADPNRPGTQILEPDDFHFVLFQRAPAGSVGLTAAPTGIGNQVPGVKSARLVNTGASRAPLFQFDVKLSALAGSFAGVGVAWPEPQAASRILPFVPKYNASPKAWRFQSGAGKCGQSWTEVAPKELGSSMAEAPTSGTAAKAALEARVLAGGLPRGLVPGAVYLFAYNLVPSGYMTAPSELQFLVDHALSEQDERDIRQKSPKDFPTLNFGAIYQDLWRAAYDPPNGGRPSPEASAAGPQALLAFRVN